MYFLEHNHDTSLKIFAKTLEERLGKIQTYRSNTEIDKIKTGKFVSIVKESVKDDLEKLIKLLSNSDSSKNFLPKLLIAQSNTIEHNKDLSLLKFDNKESVRLVNKNDSNEVVHLAGTKFGYTTRWQILLLTNTTFNSKEIMLELLPVLKSLKTLKYSLRLYDDTKPKKFYEVEDYGRLDIMGFENEVIESMPEEHFIVSGISFDVRESYFRLRDADVYKKKEVISSVKESQSSNLLNDNQKDVLPTIALDTAIVEVG